jgi:(1->4)-alpha-D-glucan 1-alpha-D-glucosylmutase
MLLQTLFGAWPANLAASDAEGLGDYAERIVAWQEKALREAKLRSSWEAPDESYESRCHDLVRALLDAERSVAFLDDMAAFVDRILPAADANSLAQVALRYTVPGVPDLYQGTETADLSLVDPDNRRPVDYTARREMLATASDPKATLIARLLALRRQHPTLFAVGAYEPIAVTGARAEHVIAFDRTHGGVAVRCVVALRSAGRCLDATDTWWADTALSSGEKVADLLGGSAVSVVVMDAVAS